MRSVLLPVRSILLQMRSVCGPGGRLCILKPSENDKSEHSLDCGKFPIVKMRNISREIIRQEILCRIVLISDVFKTCVAIVTTSK